MTWQLKSKLKTQGLTWLAFPAALQVTSTLVVFLIGRIGLLPDQFDSNGTGISFASDGTRYQLESTALVQTLTNNGIVAWLKAAPSSMSRFILWLMLPSAA